MRAWLFGIARRKIADYYRRRTRRPQTLLTERHPAPNEQNPEPLFLADEAARTLYGILSSLPDDQREALRLRYIDELSLGDISRILGKSPNATGQLLHRARQAIRVRGADYFGTDLAPEERK
jgi:RNA polymerase sigma-70 factor (ECF subfamily)